MTILNPTMTQDETLIVCLAEASKRILGPLGVHDLELASRALDELQAGHPEAATKLLQTLLKMPIGIDADPRQESLGL